MGLKYAFFHWSVHLLLVILIYLIFNLNWLNFLLVLLVAGLIDSDHIFMIRKSGGIINWAKNSMKFHMPRKYPLHNFLTIIIFLIGSFFVFNQEFFAIGICSLSVALHLLWDFIEDAFILKMGIKHWKV